MKKNMNITTEERKRFLEIFRSMSKEYLKKEMYPLMTVGGINHFMMYILSNLGGK